MKFNSQPCLEHFTICFFRLNASKPHPAACSTLTPWGRLHRAETSRSRRSCVGSTEGAFVACEPGSKTICFLVGLTFVQHTLLLDSMERMKGHVLEVTQISAWSSISKSRFFTARVSAIVTQSSSFCLEYSSHSNIYLTPSFDSPCSLYECSTSLSLSTSLQQSTSLIINIIDNDSHEGFRPVGASLCRRFRTPDQRHVPIFWE